MGLFNSRVTYRPEAKNYEFTFNIIPEYLEKYMATKVPDEIVSEFVKLYVKEKYEEIAGSIDKKAMMNQIYMEVARRISIKKPRKKRKEKKNS